MVDARDFRTDWVANGPMVPNLTPGDAILRLKLFQQMFEVASTYPVLEPLASSSILCSHVWSTASHTMSLIVLLLGNEITD